MTVKDCMKLAAAELGIEDAVEKYFSGDLNSGQAGKTLLQCYNLIENELALDYFPLIAEDEVQTNTGMVDFSNLSCAMTKIWGVTDMNGEAVKYRLFPKYIKTQPGRLKIRYIYAPQEKTADEECEFAAAVSKRMVAYGMAAEYCMHMGLYEEADAWDKKYKGAIEAAYKGTPCKRISSRRWV